MDSPQPPPWAKRVGITSTQHGGKRLELRCGGLRLGPDAAEPLCQWIEATIPPGRVPPTAWVDMRGFALSDMGVQRLIECFRRIGSSPERLWLCSNSLTNAVVPHLLQLASVPVLRELHLSENFLDDDAALELLSGLAAIVQGRASDLG